MLMITGGTSPFPIWAILLTIAVPLTALTLFAAFKVWRSTGFSEPSKRRIAFFVLTALTLSAWVGYGITSRERWASRAFAVEVMDAFDHIYDQKPWPSVGDGGGDCPSPAGDASVTAESSVPRPELADLDAESLAREFESIEQALTELEESGYEIERGVSATLNSELVRPIFVSFLVTRDDDAAQVVPAGERLGVVAATTECNSGRPLGLFRSRQFGAIDELTVETVCAIEHEQPVFPAACGDR